MKLYKVELNEKEIKLLTKYGYDYMVLANDTIVTKKTYVMINKVIASIYRKEGLVEQSPLSV